MAGLTIDVFLSIMIPLSLYFIITMLGAFLTDMINTIRKKDTTCRVARILIGAIFGSFIMTGFESLLLERFTLQQLLLIALILGSVSFELFDRVSKLDTLIKYIKVFHEAKKNLDVIEKEEKDNQDKK